MYMYMYCISNGSQSQGDTQCPLLMLPPLTKIWKDKKKSCIIEKKIPPGLSKIIERSGIFYNWEWSESACKRKCLSGGRLKLPTSHLCKLSVVKEFSIVKRFSKSSHLYRVVLEWRVFRLSSKRLHQLLPVLLFLKLGLHSVPVPVLTLNGTKCSYSNT